MDDEPALARMVALILKKQGHRVELATSGDSALNLLEQQEFDVVITDLGLGSGVNGWHVAEQVAQRWPRVRVALATGWGAGIDEAEARARGIQAVVAKPYTAETLRAVVGRIAAQDFGRHIRHSAAHTRCAMHRFKGPSGALENLTANAPCQAEIQNFCQTIGSDNNIRSLQVPMNDAFVVSATASGIRTSPPLWFAVPLTRGLWIFLLSFATHTLLRIVGDRFRQSTTKPPTTELRVSRRAAEELPNSFRGL